MLTDGAQIGFSCLPSAHSLAVRSGTYLGPTANGCHEGGVDPACSAPSSAQKATAGYAHSRAGSIYAM